MRYLGGKSRTAKAITVAIVDSVGGPSELGVWWDACCGGLASATALADHGPGFVSDANPALIALYEAVRGGWKPPEVATPEEWYHARDHLPVTDPLHGFMAMCSYGAMWYSSPDVVRKQRWNKKQKYWCDDNTVGANGRAVMRDVATLVAAGCTLQVADFLTASVPAGIRTIYCDPPYECTTGYKAVKKFDHDVFWRRCGDLANLGYNVFVSEYQQPSAERLPSNQVVEIWNRPSGCMIAGTGSGLDARADADRVTAKSRVERLFRVLPRANT